MDGILMSSRPKGWPRHAYQKRAGAIFFGFVAVFAAWMFEWQFEWDGMQKYYLAHYVVANTGLIHKFLVLHTVDRKGKFIPRRVALRQCKYLNNVIEQDHRTVKKRVWLAKGYGSFQSAWRTPKGSMK